MSDFKLHHTDWNKNIINPNQQACQLVEWVTRIGATYILELRTITHAQGKYLDLVISSKEMTKKVYHCYFDLNTDTTSNYNVIITEIAIN